MPTKHPRLKIGLVLDDTLDKPDGVQQYVLNIGAWLSAQGHEVHYLVGETKRADRAGIHSLSRNVSVRFNGNRLSVPLPTSRTVLARFLTAEKFDVLHVQVPYSPFLAHRLILAAPRDTAIIGTFHILPNSAAVTLATKILARWTWRSTRRFGQIVSVSPAAADFARRTYGIPPVVVPNVVDYRHFHDALALSRYGGGPFTILFLGRLVPRKGCLLLLQAVAQLATDKQVPKFRVVICGKGPLMATLRRYVTAHDLGGLVEFVGFVSEAEKPRYYASADMAVFPSSGGESFGIVLLEAMASGHAVVLAGDNPGYRSVLSARPELLFDPGDARLLAAKIASYMRDKPAGDEARFWGEKYTRDFDIALVGERLLACYDKALRKRAQP